MLRLPPSIEAKSNFGTMYSLPFGAMRKIRPRSVSCWACPPTPGSYQSATNSEPSGARLTSTGKPVIPLAAQNIHDPGLIARTLVRRWVRSHDAEPRIGMNHLIREDGREQVAFVDRHAGWAPAPVGKRFGTTPGSVRCQ